MIRPISSSRRSSGGFTLLEVLIATAVTLLLMLGLAQIFRVLGDSITKGRASLELNNRLRNVIHRIRTDLESVTVNPIPPVKHGSAQGYLKYYDGPATDFSFATNPLLNRFGDLDDIFMATIKAEDAWFTGKVPRFVLNGTVPSSVADVNGNDIPDELEDLVTISSQFAEVVVFAEPLTSVVGNPLRDPVFLAGDVSNFEDSFPGTTGVPDGFRLQYRLLLIRPDLNLPTGVLPFLAGGNAATDPSERIFVVGPENLQGFHPIPATATAPLPSPTCDMFRVHQFCDLSVRRVNDFDPSTLDPIAANSLEDLANPANRFAHVQYQIPGTGTDVYYSMPVLALGPTISALPNFVFQGLNPSVAGAGFLHPAFTLFGNRTGEDLLASDILAFDIKAFDASAPVIRNFGANATNDGGAVGSDDVMLRPGDPGFYTHGIQALGLSATIESQGEFVDLCWADDVKLGTKPTMSTAQFDTQYVFLQSVLSGIRFDAGYDEYPVTSLFKSGLAIPGMIYQPSYDTFTDYYESNGKVERERLPLRGTVQLISGTSPSLPDAGTDGVDSNGDNLPDDPFEKETNPPFETNLRGLQISVRLEDRATKQFSQMSTIKEFVNH
jgi:type II secretory pathway pseudopilin PulG